ncbi:hypothetical protein BU16DRAFT_525030 [Lophium mytilinum]|uniref:Uncharacterized protein n=1 Tax=Lophium mytilinum TaxID=390894 RepID=A0A6A6QXZ9_9PEZI|nr:hypothetical protein BU16DRAFT_525030 [Lophium mytilinum]
MTASPEVASASLEHEHTHLEDEEILTDQETSSEDESDDESLLELFDYGENLRGDLCEALDAINHAGEFAAFGTAFNPVNPGLHVPGIGKIRLPLDDEDFRNQGVSESVTGPKTLFKNCENAWNTFSFQNPSWEAFRLEICTKIFKAMELQSGDCRATLLSCSTETSTEHPSQSDDSIATVVFCLPSEHVGGEITLTHDGHTKQFATDQTSSFDLSYFAWYSDVDVQVISCNTAERYVSLTFPTQIEPVTSGRRVFLVYSLYQNVHPIQTAFSLGAEKRALLTVMDHWRKYLEAGADADEAYLSYVLDSGQAVDADKLRLDSLAGLDAARVRCLEPICEETGYRLLLAHLEREVTGSCEPRESYEYGYGRYGRHRYWEPDSEDDDEVHEMIEEIDETMKLTRVVELDGTEVAHGVHVFGEELAQDFPFEYKDVDEEINYDEDRCTHVWRTQVALLIEESAYVPFILKRGNLSFDQKRDWLSRTIVAEHSDAFQLCKVVLEPAFNAITKCRANIATVTGLRHSDLESIISFALKEDEYDIFARASACLWQPVSEQCVMNIKSSILRSGFEPHLKALKETIQSVRHARTTIQASVTIYENCLRLLSGPTLPDKTKWQRDNLQTLFFRGGNLEASDAEHILSTTVEQGPNFLIESIIGILRDPQVKQEFVESYLSAMAKSVEKNVIQPPIAANLLQQIFPVAKTRAQTSIAAIRLIQLCISAGKGQAIPSDQLADFITALLPEATRPPWTQANLSDLFQSLRRSEKHGDLPSQFFVDFVRGFAELPQIGYILSHGPVLLEFLVQLRNSASENLVSNGLFDDLCQQVVERFVPQMEQYTLVMPILQRLFEAKVTEQLESDLVTHFVERTLPELPNSNDPSLLLAFGHLVYHAATQMQCTQAASTQTFRVIFPNIIGSVTLRHPNSQETQHKRQKTHESSSDRPNLPLDREGEELAKDVECYAASGLNEETVHMLDKIRNEASLVAISAFESRGIPFLKLLARSQYFREGDIAPAFNDMTRNLLTFYIRQKTTSEPLRTPDLDMRLAHSCGCQDCRDLDIFVANAQKTVEEFSRITAVRNHLEKRILAGFEVSLRKGRAPFTLIIQKKEARWKAAHDKWSKDRESTRRVISQLPRTEMQGVLGERFNELYDLEAPVRPAFSSTPTGVTPKSGVAYETAARNPMDSTSSSASYLAGSARPATTFSATNPHLAGRILPPPVTSRLAPSWAPAQPHPTVPLSSRPNPLGAYPDHGNVRAGQKRSAEVMIVDLTGD